MTKPIRVFYSTLSERFFASAQYCERPDGVFVITGEKFDVTDDIARAITAHQVEFKLAPVDHPLRQVPA